MTAHFLTFGEGMWLAFQYQRMKDRNTLQHPSLVQNPKNENS